MPLVNVVHLSAKQSPQNVFDVLNRMNSLSLREGESWDATRGDEEGEGKAVFSLNLKTYSAVLQSFKELLVHLGTRLSPFSPLLFHLLSLCLHDLSRDSHKPTERPTVLSCDEMNDEESKNEIDGEEGE